MRELRFGSYSMVATVAGMPYLSRLKSMRRSFCLWPPPWWRMVMRPVLLRPPVRCLTESSGLCGLSVVRSSFTSFVWKRSVGVIGRNDLIGILFTPSYQLFRLKLVLFHVVATTRRICFQLTTDNHQRTTHLQAVEILRHLLSFFQPDIGLLPIG